MKKELRFYDTIEGLTDYDEWSYCEENQMWYEDLKEVLPQPKQESEIITDLVCEIKINHDAYIWNELEDWDRSEEEKNGLEEFAQYVIGENKDSDYTFNAFLFKTPQHFLSLC